MVIIGLTGLKQSGKSTAAKYLKTSLSFQQVNFKDALISEINEFFPDFIAMEASHHNVTVEQLFDLKPGAMRQFMQNFGTELRRGSNKNYWVGKWARNIEAHHLLSSSPQPIHFVVDDVRFLNEAEAIRNADGRIVQIVKIGQESIDEHSSETEMSQIKPDWIIMCPEGHPELIEEEILKYVESLSI